MDLGDVAQEPEQDLARLGAAAQLAQQLVELVPGVDEPTFKFCPHSCWASHCASLWRSSMGSGQVSCQAARTA